MSRECRGMLFKSINSLRIVYMTIIYFDSICSPNSPKSS